MEKNYLKEYNEFVADYYASIADPKRAGEVLARMSQYYAENNAELVKASKALALTARDVESRVDTNTGKPITSAKAAVLVDATEEAFAYAEAKMNLQNVEQFINSLKTIAKLITNEYSAAGTL